MKKVFWTSIVWIILFWWFALYMKWFDQPLAEVVTNFVYHAEECPVAQCDMPTCAPCICENECPTCTEIAEPVCEENEVAECNCPTCEVAEPAECNCPAQMVTDTEVCTKVFNQLDRIEKKISSTSTEKTEEDLLKEFEEFKARRENK